jgi:hypothetical protein
MITRDFNADWKAGCAGAPPPLHVTDDNPQANWWPAERPYLMLTPPGPQLVTIAQPNPFGDDPTDTSQQTVLRHHSPGMVARLNGMAQANIGPGGARS